MSLSGPGAFAVFVLVAAGLPALDVVVLRALARRAPRREQGRFLGPEQLGIRAGQLADLMILLLADLLVVGLIAFAVAGSGYNRALALLLFTGIAALVILVAIHRRRRATPLSG
jgi:hypothetical protein